MNGFSLLDVYLALASLVAVVSAALAVRSREDFYSAIMLGLTGLATASLMALIGYGFVAVFHAFVYVGATVMFVVFGVVLIGRTGGFEKRSLLPAALTSLLLTLALYVFFYSVGRGAVATASIDPSRIQEVLFRDPLTVFFLGVSLAVLVVAGIMIASGDTPELKR
ncbi:NADH-quinone oxidoreductase subunit J [Infirmifilum lucidum]|uniref:NADH-quinone oxidoreductase subunit J n=1 Tax=Infirmifilum lucidum TaxID=2776706 RepID=A0A7L9FHL2_9CREN|nr:NADH-quinone oxidoreductase subunit J [Infirmifilum lucidum]QOJ79318.1 NADH-quinone oxidoreductase subunit J [Infirmifilum lucidum]